MLLVLQLGADGHYDLANVDPGHCALGLSKGTAHTCLEPRLGTACQSLMSTGKGCLQGPLGQPTQATGCIHYPGGCCLQPLRTGPPWGEEHGRLNWLQRTQSTPNRLASPCKVLLGSSESHPTCDHGSNLPACRLCHEAQRRATPAAAAPSTCCPEP